MTSAKQSITDGLAKHGRNVTAVIEVDTGAGSAGALSTMKAFTGGTLAPDRLTVVLADGPWGPESIVVPEAGMSVLPGEYHLSIPGAVRAPVQFRGGGFGSGWNAGGDKELAKWFKKGDIDAFLLPDKLTQGTTKINLTWMLQVFPTAVDRSTVVFTLGGVHTMIDLDQYVTVATKIAAAIGASGGVGPMPALDALVYDDVIAAARSNQLTSTPAAAAPAAAAPAPPSPPADRSAAIGAALSGHDDKRVHVGTPDGKVLDNVLKKVAKGVNPAAIVGFLDTGMRANGKAGLAFTRDTLYISEIGDNWVIPYDEIAGYELIKTNLHLAATRTGNIKVDVMGVEGFIGQAMAAATTAT